MDVFYDPKNIKKECMGADCENRIPGTINYYFIHGNFCNRCERRINQRVLDNRGRGRIVEALLQIGRIRK